MAQMWPSGVTVTSSTSTRSRASGARLENATGAGQPASDAEVVDDVVDVGAAVEAVELDALTLADGVGVADALLDGVELEHALSESVSTSAATPATRRGGDTPASSPTHGSGVGIEAGSALS